MKRFKRTATLTMEMVVTEGELLFPIMSKSLREFADLLDGIGETPTQEFNKKTWDDRVNIHWKATDPIEIESDIPVDDPIGIGDGTGMDPDIEGTPAPDGGAY